MKNNKSTMMRLLLGKRMYDYEKKIIILITIKNFCIKMKNRYELMNFTVLATSREEVIPVNLENY